MSSPTPAELQAMRALAEKATPGLWRDLGPRVVGPDGQTICNGWPSDRAFIAAAHPQRIIEIIDALVSARAALQKYGNHREECDIWPKCSCGWDAARAHLGGQAPQKG